MPGVPQLAHGTTARLRTGKLSGVLHLMGCRALRFGYDTEFTGARGGLDCAHKGKTAMKHVAGLVISTIEGGAISDGGTALRLITTVPGDAEVVLSFPYEQLLNLIALAAKGRTDCKRQRGIEPNDQADLMATVKFELGIDRRSGIALVMFTLNNGAKLSFALPDPLPAQMHRVLGTMLDGDAAKRHPGSFVN